MSSVDFKDYYTTLGVSKTATDKEIKQAFRKLARKYHPDVNPGDKGAEARFKEVNEANEVLSDPQKRKKYDELGANWRAYENAPPGASPYGGLAVRRAVDRRRPRRLPHDERRRNGGHVRRRRRRQPVLRLLQDVLRRHGRTRNRPARAAAARGRAAARARTSSIRSSSISRTRSAAACSVCSCGTTAMRAPWKCAFPPGVTDGSRVRVAGEGGRGTGQRAERRPVSAGAVEAASGVRREGPRRLHAARVPVPIAVLGGEVDVVTPESKTLRLKIPAGHAERPAIPPARPRLAGGRQTR